MCHTIAFLERGRLCQRPCIPAVVEKVPQDISEGDGENESAQFYNKLQFDQSVVGKDDPTDRESWDNQWA